MTNFELAEKLLEYPETKVLVDTGPYDEDIVDMRLQQVRCSSKDSPFYIILEAGYNSGKDHLGEE